MHVKIHLNKLILKTKFTISHGAYDYRNQLIVELSENGISGFGETIAIDYYGIEMGDLHAKAMELAPLIESISNDIHHEEFYQFLEAKLPGQAFLRCAFDTAFIDLQCRKKSISIREFFNIPPKLEVSSSITIGISDTDQLIESYLEEGWPVLKIKLNKEINRDFVMKSATLNHKEFGVDANGGLDMGQAQNIIDLVTYHKGLYVEQLMDKQAPVKNLKALRLPKGLPHFADEQICNLEDIEKYGEYFDGVVLKLTKCGGITPSLKMMESAKKNDLMLLAGCMTESSIGINHMLQLLPQFDYADLDGAYLIKNDREVCSIDCESKRILHPDGAFY